MRLFVALDLSNNDFFSSIQSQFPRFIKASFPSHFHLTLKFLGDVADPAPIISSLKKINFSSFSLSSSDIGFFPDKNHIRVVWLGLKDSPELLSLKGSIDSVLPGFDNHFVPHVTLARLKSSVKHTFFSNLSFPEKVFPINSFYLFSSVLTSSGPVYSVVASFKP